MVLGAALTSDLAHTRTSAAAKVGFFSGASAGLAMCRLGQL
jgi:hypothetical protein